MIWLKTCLVIITWNLRFWVSEFSKSQISSDNYQTSFQLYELIICSNKAPGGWRPIALLSTVGKVIESAVSRRVADAAEDHQLLPEGQMGNRRERSMELAIRAVTDAVYTAWAQNTTTSLLQLDIKGAFDMVNHVRLLDMMRRKGYPPWLVRWLQSYLEG